MTECKPTHLCWSSGLIFASGLVVFYILQNVGEKLIRRNDEIERRAKADSMVDADDDPVESPRKRAPSYEFQLASNVAFNARSPSDSQLVVTPTGVSTSLADSNGAENVLTVVS
eukprot:FR738463.1.p1 GENE.FR738463.1~~FR738463.1.p1  ORF type:complete len:134 (+),score=2.99 FR738463.1:63-404(+)